MTKKTDVASGKSKSGVTRSFVEHGTFLKKFLSGFLRHEQDVEDVAQEAYLKAYCSEQERDIEQPKAFLFSIAKNLALNELTRKSRQMTTYIEECQAPHLLADEMPVETEIEALESLGSYCEAVAALPIKTRRIYLYRKVHGLPHKEIALRMGVSLSTVEKHLKIGLVSCRDYMARQASHKGGEQPTSADLHVLKECLKNG